VRRRPHGHVGGVAESVLVLPRALGGCAAAELALVGNEQSASAGFNRSPVRALSLASNSARNAGASARAPTAGRHTADIPRQPTRFPRRQPHDFPPVPRVAWPLLLSPSGRVRRWGWRDEAPAYRFSCDGRGTDRLRRGQNGRAVWGRQDLRGVSPSSPRRSGAVPRLQWRRRPRGPQVTPDRTVVRSRGWTRPATRHGRSFRPPSS